MHFALKGSDGVEFTVAGETRGYGGDGHAIVLPGLLLANMFRVSFGPCSRVGVVGVGRRFVLQVRAFAV